MTSMNQGGGRSARWLAGKLVERLAWLLLSFASLSLVGCLQSTQISPIEQGVDPSPSQASPDGKTFTLVGAGDISSCKNPEGARATAKLLERFPGTVFAAGDLAYEGRSPDEFRLCYGATWGEFKDRTRPALGNHEYANPTAHGYFEYWGAQAGPAGKGYYSYDFGNWHIVVLNTNCNSEILGGCSAGSPQETWLRKDLSEHPDAC